MLPTVDDLNGLDFPINPERAGPCSAASFRPADIRGRIYDRDGLLVVDSRGLYSRGDIVQTELPPLAVAQRLFRPRPMAQVQQLAVPQRISLASRNTASRTAASFPKSRPRSNGASVSIVRVNDENEIIVSVAVPIQRFRAVLGSLVLSTKGGEIDKVLRGERKIVLFTFLVAVLVTMLLSMLLPAPSPSRFAACRTLPSGSVAVSTTASRSPTSPRGATRSAICRAPCAT